MNEKNQIVIRNLDGFAEVELCAKMMVDTEPWITLKRNYSSAINIINDLSREVYVANVNGVLVGFSILMMKGIFIGYIQSICIDPKYRNRGIGSALIDHAEKRIFSETPNVFICVSSFNKDAQRLYIRNGYEIVGELKDYIVSGHSEILLRKTISPLVDYKKSETK
ncbi:MAG: N-acetyltransferase [Ignavibacteriales bacterium]|nr:N-acetyltransferase [Ignavibacteriales bacterium]